MPDSHYSHRRLAALYDLDSPWGPDTDFYVALAGPLAEKVSWVQSDVESYRSAERFDLVTMTGHAFQVLLTDESILAAFETIVKHLNPGGLVAFESRNPTMDWDLEWS